MTVRPLANSHRGGRTRYTTSVSVALLLTGALTVSACAPSRSLDAPTTDGSEVRTPSTTSASTPAAGVPANGTPVTGSAYEVIDITPEMLESLLTLHVLFAHRSVGGSILDVGVPAVFRSAEMTPPTGSASPFIDHWLEQPEDPLLKVHEFDTVVRSFPIDQAPDVALMKIGYIDVGEGTDIHALFDEYRVTLASLEADYPGVTFLHATVSVTGWRAEDSVVVERFNALMRSEYAPSGRLYDLAAVLGTCDDGRLNADATEDGQPYVSICPALTSDGGHLNEMGARRAAAALIDVIASAST